MLKNIVWQQSCKKLSDNALAEMGESQNHNRVNETKKIEIIYQTQSLGLWELEIGVPFCCFMEYPVFPSCIEVIKGQGRPVGVVLH